MTKQYTPAELKKVVDLLESWAADQIPPMDNFQGICYNLLLHDGRITLDWTGLVAKAAESWPEFSGNPRYPVPHPDLLPESAYTAKWEVPKWSGEYGTARRRLCRHIANWIRTHPMEASHILSLWWK